MSLIELTFNFLLEIPIKKNLQFYKRNPFNFFPFFQQRSEFYTRNPFKFFLQKINTEIFASKIP